MSDEKYGFESEWVKNFEAELYKQFCVVCDKVNNGEENINSKLTIDVPIPFENRDKVWEYVEDIIFDYQVELDNIVEIENGIRYTFNVIIDDI